MAKPVTVLPEATFWAATTVPEPLAAVSTEIEAAEPGMTVRVPE